MKKVAIVAITLAAFGLVVGCGSSGSVCEDAANVMMQGMDEACAQQTDCCYCTCWNDGHKVPDMNAQDCQCVAGDDGGGQTAECTGDAKAAAEACLADEAACKAQGAAVVTAMCPAGG